MKTRLRAPARRRRSVNLLSIAMLLVVAFWPAAAFAGNDWVQGELRVDLPEVYNARDYTTYLYAADRPRTSGGYTDAYVGVDLAQYNGQVFSAQFSQVGLWTDVWGARWFIYAEPGVECLRGFQYWETRTSAVEHVRRRGP